MDSIESAITHSFQWKNMGLLQGTLDWPSQQIANCSSQTHADDMSKRYLEWLSQQISPGKIQKQHRCSSQTTVLSNRGYKGQNFTWQGCLGVSTSWRTCDQLCDWFSSTLTSSSSASSLPACMYVSTAPMPVSRAAICMQCINLSRGPPQPPEPL